MKIYAGIFKSHSRSWALETAQNHFEQATEPSLIDCYIYEWNAAQLRYQFLLRKFKNMED